MIANVGRLSHSQNAIAINGRVHPRIQQLRRRALRLLPDDWRSCDSFKRVDQSSSSKRKAMSEPSSPLNAASDGNSNLKFIFKSPLPLFLFLRDLMI